MNYDTNGCINTVSILANSIVNVNATNGSAIDISGYEGVLKMTADVGAPQTGTTPSVTFILARIVRYDVNQFSTATDYAKGVYDSDGRSVEFGTKENAATELRPALCVFDK